MPLCFEVTVNDEPPILTGLRDLKVLTAIVSFVADRDELTLDVGGMVDRSDHVKWLERNMRRGDIVTIRIVDSDEAAEPATRERVDPASDADRERAYYEHLRRQYEPEKSSSAVRVALEQRVTSPQACRGFPLVPNGAQYDNLPP